MQDTMTRYYVKNGINSKQIYAGVTVRYRMANLEHDIRACGVTPYTFALIGGMNHQSIYHFMKGQSMPTLQNYLKLGSLLEWDLSCDANYIFANQIYKSTLLKRIQRCRLTTWGSLPVALVCTKNEVMRCVEYRNDASLTLFAELLRFVGEEEARRGYIDCIQVEL